MWWTRLNQEYMKIKFIFLIVICFSNVFYACSENSSEFPENVEIKQDDKENSVIEIDVNRVFFSPVGRLTNVIESGKNGEQENQGKFYKYTKGWSNISDTLVWGIDVINAGELKVVPILGVPEVQHESEIELLLDNQKQLLKLKSTGGFEKFSSQDTVIFQIDKPGRYQLGMKIASVKQNQEIAYVKGVNLTGKAAEKLKAVVLRWRPLAVHCGFRNNTDPSEVVMAVHENTIATPWIDCYQPITSPFGYYGSTWNAQNQQFGGLNFSLWSFAANAEPPASEKFSHLIAVGEGFYIDGFNHEGTGVKARGENPYEKMHGTTQVLAIKKIPGIPYDVYYSYYWNTTIKRWKLLGCGKKYNKSGIINYLTTGAFVEVPGAAEKERSNHVLRQVDFRGWLKDSNGKWYPINTMSPTGNLDESSYKNWGKTKDNKFFMQTGGFNTLLSKRPEPISILSDIEMPEYLSSENMKDLEKLPATIEMLGIESSEITSSSVIVHFNIKETGTNAKAYLYWDTKDGLTFVKGNKGGAGVVEWSNVQEISIPSDGTLFYKLENLKPNTNYYYRLQIKSDQGETWSFDTQKFKTNF